jgi:hypothetical protein
MTFVIYLFFYFLSFLFSYSYRCKDTKELNSGFYFLLFTFIVFITPVLSSLYSVDYGNYYKDYISFSKLQTFEPFYILLKRICHSLYFSAYTYFLCISIIKFALLFAVVKESENPYLSLFLYFSSFYFTDGITTIRSGLSSVCFLCALLFKTRGKFKTALLFCIFSVCTHFSGIISFIPLFMSTKKFNRKLWFLFLLISYLLVFFGVSSSTLFTGAQYLPLPVNLKDRIALYTSLATGKRTVNIFSIGILIQILFIILIIKNINKFGKKYYIYIKTYILSLVMLIFLSDTDTFGFRINQFLMLPEIILLPGLSNTARTKERKIEYNVLIVFYALFRLLSHFKSQTLRLS